MIPKLCKALKKLCVTPLSHPKTLNLSDSLLSPERDAKKLFTFLKRPGRPPTNNHTEREHLPVDFVSTHHYPTDFPFDDATKKHRRVVRDRDATFHHMTLLRRVVDKGPFPRAEIHCAEWGSYPGARDCCHDHLFSGTFLLENILRCEDLVDSLSAPCQ